MSETAPCDKCESEISTAADRCPECGFEPSMGVGGTIALYLSLPVFLFSALLLVIIPALVVSGGLAVSDGVISFGMFALFAGGSGAVLWAGAKQDQRTPTDPSLTG